jgi:ATP-binding cassette subfamily C protein
MAHRPAAIKECDKLLVLENGTCAAFGPKDQVLRDMVKNAGAIHTSKPEMAGVQ